VFEVIAEPNRLAILSLLALSEQSVGEIERQLHMQQPTVSKHLRVSFTCNLCHAAYWIMKTWYDRLPTILHRPTSRRSAGPETETPIARVGLSFIESPRTKIEPRIA
jgi:DNA-binding transcriptional ArsR family regulator